MRGASSDNLDKKPCRDSDPVLSPFYRNPTVLVSLFDGIIHIVYFDRNVIHSNKRLVFPFVDLNRVIDPYLGVCIVPLRLLHRKNILEELDVPIHILCADCNVIKFSSHNFSFKIKGEHSNSPILQNLKPSDVPCPQILDSPLCRRIRIRIRKTLDCAPTVVSDLSECAEYVVEIQMPVPGSMTL